MERLKLNIQKFATSGTLTTPNNTDGTSFYFYWSRQSYSIADNKSTIYWQIGINAAYSYYSNGVKLGPTTVNGTVIHSGGTYSNISRGTHTMFEGTMDIPHNPDGTKSFSASLSGWTWESTWTSADNSNNPFVLDTIPRYTTVSTWSVTSRTETSITLSWKTADTCSQIRYGTSQSSYTTANVNGNSGSVTISGLQASQTYTLYFMPKRKDSSLWGDGSDNTWKSLANQSTQPYPYAETMPAFTIGENPTIGIKNPLNRTFTITVYGADNSTIYTGSNKTGTSIKDILNGAAEVNKLYQSLPTTKNGKYKVKIETSLPSSTTKESTNLYSVNENDCRPVFNDFTYADINSTTTALTGDDQKVIQGYSNIQATISVANKATPAANKGSTMSRYDLIIDGNNTQSASYSENTDVTITTNGANSGSIKVSAVDSRNVAKEVPKTAALIPYTNIQRGNITVTRAGNVGEATTLAFEGTMWSGDFGAVTNAITSVQYRYKSTAAGSSWSAYASLTPPTPSGNSYSFSGLIAGDEGNTGFSVDNSFNIEVVVSDRLSSITFTATLGTGIPWIAVADDGIAINGPYNENLDSGLQVNGKLYLNDKEIDMNGDFVVNSIRTKNIFDGLLERGSFYNVDGTKIDSTSRVRSTNFMKVDSGNYTISVSNSNYYVVVYVYGIDGTWKSSESIVGWQSLPYTINIQGERKIKIALRNSAGTNITPSDVSNVMVEKGTSATTYKPYQNLDSNDYYSNVEQQIGYWIDGKPLYRKVMNVGNKPTDGTIYVSNVVSNLDTLVSIRGTAYSSYWNQHYNIPNVHPDMNFYLNALLINKTDLQIRGGSGWTNYGGLSNIYVVIEYTKTTD